MNSTNRSRDDDTIGLAKGSDPAEFAVAYAWTVTRTNESANHEYRGE